MLRQAIGSPGYLEQLSGLQAMLAEAAGRFGDMELGGSSEEGEEGAAGSGSGGEGDEWTEL